MPPMAVECEVSMDDFRKPYEYAEEKRGYLLLFIIMILTIDLLQSPFYIVQVYNILKKVPVVNVGFLFISTLYVLLLLYTALSCYKLKKHMVSLSKAYLIFRAAFKVCCILIAYIYNVDGKSMIGNGNQYSTVAEYTVMGLIMPLIFELVFSVGWYLYFIKSKRCREFVQKRTAM